MQYVRARIIWSNEPGADRSRRRRQPHRRPVLRVRRRAGDSRASSRGSSRSSLGEVIGDDYVVRSGLKPGERVIVSNVQKIGDGAPVT